jgi:hypothetical protein
MTIHILTSEKPHLHDKSEFAAKLSVAELVVTLIIHTA